MSKCAEILAMTREEKEREIYKEFFFASDELIIRWIYDNYEN